jgi:hypothetical protein
MPDNPTTKFRPHQWINTNTLKTIYSIQARVGRTGWAHVYEGGKPMFFDAEADRDAKLKEMNDEH